MCWKCDAVRAARQYDNQQWGRDEPFDITDAMLLDYAQRHGVTYDDATDAFLFAAAAIQPSRARH
jgi:hypothetical protein